MGGPPRLLLCAPAGDGRGLAAAAAAVGVAATPPEADVRTLLVDLRGEARPPRGTVFAGAAARELEGACRASESLRGAARGRLCFATAPDAADADGRAAALGEALEDFAADLVVAVCDRGDFRTLLAAGSDARRSVLLKADRGGDRPLIALLAAELRSAATPFKVWIPPLGASAPGGRSQASSRVAPAVAGPSGSRGRWSRCPPGAAAVICSPACGPNGRKRCPRSSQSRSWSSRSRSSSSRSAARRPPRAGCSGPPISRRSRRPARCATTSAGCSCRRRCRTASRTPPTSTGASISTAPATRPRSRPSATTSTPG